MSKLEVLFIESRHMVGLWCLLGQGQAPRHINRCHPRKVLLHHVSWGRTITATMSNEFTKANITSERSLCTKLLEHIAAYKDIYSRCSSCSKTTFLNRLKPQSHTQDSLPPSQSSYVAKRLILPAFTAVDDLSNQAMSRYPNTLQKFQLNMKHLQRTY